MSRATTLREATPADRSFLLKVYTDTRIDELAASTMTQAEKEAFCRQQFEAQDAHYRKHFPACEYLVIERDSQPIGRLYRDRRADEIRVVDIALVRAERGHGVGGGLMQDVLDEAARDGLNVRIHVEKSNPARRLYERLGFRVEETGDVYDLLVWQYRI